MLETLLLIPHELAGIPIFGVGWALGFGVIALIVRAGWVARLISRQTPFAVSPTDENSVIPWSWSVWLTSEGFFWGVAAAVIWKVIPAVELTNVDGNPVGLAIRGYGVFLLCGVISGIALAVHRSRRFGIESAAIFSIAPWAFFGGIGGARLFYVIQYRDRFIGDSAFETVANMLKFTEGGLVVYGSFIGGGLAVVYFLRRNGLPVLRMGDVVVPCMFLGLFFGRIGCLMHGCCWGGRCEAQIGALEFPPGSPVYRDQMQSGELVGFAYDSGSFRVTEVQAGSAAEKSGIEVGQRIDQLSIDQSSYATADRDLPTEAVPVGLLVTTESARHRFNADELPARARPVYPAQLISSIGGLMLCGLLHLIPSGRFREGTIMLLGFAGYAVLRFVLEIVRVDEGGQFGTQWSISQWISVLVLVGSGLGLLAMRMASPPPKADGAVGSNV